MGALPNRDSVWIAVKFSHLVNFPPEVLSSFRYLISSRILGRSLCTVFALVIASFFIQSTSIFSLPICRDSNGTYSFMWNPNHTEDWNSIARNTTLWPLGGMSGDRTRVSRVESEHQTHSATKGFGDFKILSLQELVVISTLFKVIHFLPSQRTINAS